MENTAIIRKVRKDVRPSARCGRGAKKSPAKRTGRDSGNGFLNHAFKPFWAFGGNRQRAEREFFNSLSNLCRYYDLNIPDVTGYVFPQNIYRSWEIIADRLMAVDKTLDCIIVKDKQHTATVATIKVMNTGTTLYYIPVRPLWQWAQCAKQQDIAEVMLCIFAYLHTVVQIPFYTENGSYLQYQYEIIDQWVNDEQEEDDENYRQEQLDELYTLQNAGIHIWRQVTNPHRLENMESIVLKYSHSDNCDNDLAILAIEFVQLYRAYPNCTVFDNIRPDLFHPEAEERISAEQYISFYWSGMDCFTDTLDDMINSHFQEIEVMDEPLAVKVFDTYPITEQENFGFETRLFALLKRLTELLNDYDHEERKQ